MTPEVRDGEWWIVEIPGEAERQIVQVVYAEFSEPPCFEVSWVGWYEHHPLDKVKNWIRKVDLYD